MALGYRGAAIAADTPTRGSDSPILPVSPEKDEMPGILLEKITPVTEKDPELLKMDEELQKLLLLNGQIDGKVVKNLVDGGVTSVGMFHLLGDEQNVSNSQTNLGRSSPLSFFLPWGNVQMCL